MSSIFRKFLNNFKFIFFLLSLFFQIKSEIQNITFNGSFSDNYTIQNETDFSKFKVEGLKNYSTLKIKVLPKEQNSEANFILSYYQQDSNFTERRQLSQSLHNMAIMWLIKDQIENNFYFSVECQKYPCSFLLDLNTSFDSPEINIDEQYIYYVTKENEKMNFNIKSNQDLESFNKSEYILTIWTKGSKEISTSLEGINSEKFNEHNYYIVNMANFSESNNFTIEGKSGDLITIGLLLFKKEEINNDVIWVTDSILSYNGVEIVGILKENQNDKIIFRLNEYAYNLEVPYNLDTNEELIANFNEEKEDDYYTVEIRNYGEGDVIFSYKFLKEKKIDEPDKNINYPQLIGFCYSKQILEGETIALIPMKPNDFNYLTYEVINSNLEQEIKASIYKCDNYPLCNIDKNPIDNFDKIDNFKWFNFYKYNKKDWDENISPISKIQNLLLIKCEKGIDFNGNKSCLIKEDMIVDKDIIDMTGFSEANPPLYKYISKDEVNIYSFKEVEKSEISEDSEESEKSEEEPEEESKEEIYLNIETISGKIDIEVNSKEEFKQYEKGNKKLYIFPKNKDFQITIKGVNNSVYLFQDIYPMILNENLINVGANYFINLKNELTLEPTIFFGQKIEIKNDLYMGVYPLDCDLNVSTFKYEGDEKKYLNKKNGFYQEFFSNLGNKYTFINKNPSKDCLFYISYFEIDEKNGISLENNATQSFAFGPQNKKLTFSFIHTKKDTDVNFYFNFENEGNYNVNILLNDNKINNEAKKISSKNSDNSIALKSKELNDKCKNGNICKISLIIESENIDKESILNIGVNKKESKGSKGESHKGKNKILMIVFICIGIVLFIFVLLAIFVIVKTIRKNRDSELITKIESEKKVGEDILLEED